MLYFIQRFFSQDLSEITHLTRLLVFDFLNPHSFQYAFAFPGSNEITQENTVKRV